MTDILLCTLGQSWAVIPEVYALLDPAHCPIYAHHPQAESINALRTKHRLGPPDELWVCTTNDENIKHYIEHLRQWRQRIRPDMALRIWRTEETQDIADQQANEQVRELIYRAALLASEKTQADGRLLLSLAGGRKTMSADLQQAGRFFGCDALLHVIAPALLPDALMKPHVATFTQPLQKDDCKGLMPLVVGQGARSELLDIESDETRAITSAAFPLPEADADGTPMHWNWQDGLALPAELERRERESSRLLGNFMHNLATQDPHENWRSLYRLPPKRIQQLRQQQLGAENYDWLKQLPKADLHRHIGGCLDLPAQRTVGQAIWNSLSQAQQAQATDTVAPVLNSKEWEWDWPEILKQHPIDRSHLIAALLVHASDEQLQRNLWQTTRVNGKRFALKQNHPHGFASYERPGELAGSAVLGHPAALEPYITALLDSALHEGLWYLELRGSPQKYRRGIPAQIEFLQQIKTLAASYANRQPPLVLRFIIIVDRRDAEKARETVNMAVQARQRLGDFIAGLDIAGDESADSEHTARQLAAHLEPAFRECLPVTIHAGEGEPAEKIWQAAYLLHADRVGHGLTLREHENLMQRFRDRGICLELCPTSNCEVVGYDSTDYPLQYYWQNGLPLTICTDNPGISQTDSNHEYINAASLCPQGITRWDTLAMIRQGFTHSFLAAGDKRALMQTIDHHIYNLHNTQ